MGLSTESGFLDSIDNPGVEWLSIPRAALAHVRLARPRRFARTVGVVLRRFLAEDAIRLRAGRWWVKKVRLHALLGTASPLDRILIRSALKRFGGTGRARTMRDPRRFGYTEKHHKPYREKAPARSNGPCPQSMNTIKTSSIALLCAVSALAATGCAPILIGGAAVGTATVMTDRRTTGNIVSDEVIEKRVLYEITQALNNDKHHITVTSYEGRVLLTGEVGSPADRRAAQQIAKHFVGREAS